MPNNNENERQINEREVEELAALLVTLWWDRKWEDCGQKFKNEYRKRAENLINIGYRKSPASGQVDVKVTKEEILREIRMATSTSGEFFGGCFLESIVQLLSSKGVEVT